MKKISIVVPTFNEAENVGNLVNQINYALRGIPYEVIFVDDSTDNTPEVIKELVREYGNTPCRVELYHRENGSGLATAVLEGFNHATGDYIAVMDADLQHPPKMLKDMYLGLEYGAELCIPSRFIKGGSDGGLGPYRKLVSAVARYIGKLSLPCLRRISDPTGGLFMFKKDIINGADLRPVGWKILIEVIAMGNFSKVVELPYKFQARPAGESKLSSKVTLEYLKQLAGLRRRAVREDDIKVVRFTPERVRALEEEFERNLP